MALRSVALSKQARGGSRQQNRFWRTSDEVRPVPPSLGTYDTRYPKEYVVRQRRLSYNGVAEWLLQAPPWLFAAESDAKPRYAWLDLCAASQVTPRKLRSATSGEAHSEHRRPAGRTWSD